MKDQEIKIYKYQESAKVEIRLGQKAHHMQDYHMDMLKEKGYANRIGKNGNDSYGNRNDKSENGKDKNRMKEEARQVLDRTVCYLGGGGVPEDLCCLTTIKLFICILYDFL
jgi:hypothetical protein